MAGGERKLTVILAGDHKGLSSAIGGAGRDVDGLGSKIAGFGKAAAIGLGAAAVGAVALGKSFVDAAIESQKVTKQTEAVLKSMGGQAGLTAADIGRLAEKQSMLSGVDDELIQSGQNVLLTFGKVRNEVGKGNDIFNRASQSALDMSVALGTDLKGANIQLGKALNDPIKGITALGRAGVSFTEQQKDQIKAMVKAGDTLGAQKIILGEMEKQFGGSAAAQATAGEKLKVIWGNLQEQLGAKLLPVVEKVAGFLADKLPGAFDAIGKAMEPVRQAVSAFVQSWIFFQDGTTSSGFNKSMEEMGIKAREIFEGLKVAVTEVVEWFQQNWPKIQEVIGQVMTTVGTIIAGAVDVITVLWNNFGNNILEFVQRVWPAISQVIGGALEIIRGIVQTVTALIHGDWSGVWEGIKHIVSGAWSAIQGIVKAALEVLRGAIGIGMEIIGSVVKGAFNGIVGLVTGLPGRIATAASGMWNGLKAGLQSILDSIRRGAQGLVNTVVKAINGVIDAADKIAGPWINFGEVTAPVLPAITLHGGGVFRAPTPGGEGLALLRDGERVSTPFSRMGGSGSVVIARGAFEGAIIASERDAEEWVMSALNRAAAHGIG